MKCAACGADLSQGAQFCTSCGTRAPEPPPVQEEVPPLSPTLLAALEAAADTCSQAIDALITKQIDKTELEQRLFENGVVRGDGELWFLDIEHGRWCRYDGVRLWFSGSFLPESASAPGP